MCPVKPEEQQGDWSDTACSRSFNGSVVAPLRQQHFHHPIEENPTMTNQTSTKVENTPETPADLQRHIESYLDGHVLHGRAGRALDNG